MSQTLNTVIALVKKDIVRFLSSPRSLLISLAAPIFIAAFFGSLFGGNDKKPSAIPIVVIDQDDTPVSRKIMDGLKAESGLDLRPLDAVEGEKAVRAGKVRAMLTLPKGFGQSATRALFGNGERPVIDIRYDPSQAMALAVVRGLLTQQVMQHVFGGLTGQVGDAAEQVMGEARASVQQAEALSPAQRGDLTQMFDAIDKVRKQQLAPPAAAPSGDGKPAQGGFTLKAPFDLKETAAQANPAKGYNSYSQSFAGMSVQFILFMAIDLGIALLLMRRMGLWKRFRAAPLTRPVLLGASLLSMAFIAAALMTTIFLVGIFAFGVRIEGSVAGFALVIAGFAFLAASLGLLLAALGKTPEATRGLAIFVTLVLMMLGGAWVPSFVFPDWLQKLSLAMPTTWAIDGLAAMTWRGLGIEVALLNTAVLIGFSLLFILLAMWRFEWEE